jgi:hypothetical protein
VHKYTLQGRSSSSTVRWPAKGTAGYFPHKSYEKEASFLCVVVTEALSVFGPILCVLNGVDSNAASRESDTGHLSLLDPSSVGR